MRAVMGNAFRAPFRCAFAVVLVAGLAACAGEAGESADRPRATAALVGGGSPAASASTQPDAGEVVVVPSGFPESLPIPEGAEIQAGPTSCRLTWLLAGAEIDAAAADVAAVAEAAGLAVEHQASSIPGAPVPSVDPWGEETLVPGPVEQMASLTLTGAGIDAALGLTAPAPGVVLGEYVVKGSSCTA